MCVAVGVNIEYAKDKQNNQRLYSYVNDVMFNGIAFFVKPSSGQC